MPTSTVTLVASTVSTVHLPGGAGRVVVTILSGPSSVSVTTDGTVPTSPASNIETDSNQQVLVGTVGAQAVFQPIYPAGQFRADTPVNMFSVGTPTLTVQW